MGYLQPTEYALYGLTADTTDDWITVASAVIDSYCRRASLNVTQYEERLRMTADAQTVRLTYLPLAAAAAGTSPLVSIRVRYARPRRGEIIDPAYEQIAWAFSLPGTWNALDVNSVDYFGDTGELTFPMNILGLPYNEVDVTYTAGLAVIPDTVKVACAQIVKNAQATPGLNVKSSRMDTMQMTYFSDSLIDAQVQRLLQPYVASRLG
ncbi:MAG: hypothetical protein ACYCSN_18710 [Acidobacteriaceae bacterium]